MLFFAYLQKKSISISFACKNQENVAYFLTKDVLNLSKKSKMSMGSKDNVYRKQIRVMLQEIFSVKKKEKGLFIYHYV